MEDIKKVCFAELVRISLSNKIPPAHLFFTQLLQEESEKSHNWASSL